MSLTLEQAIDAAHRASDLPKLARLYRDAALEKEEAGEIDAACFFLTHAYVFALEAGDPLAAELNRRLAAHGRDDLQSDLPAKEPQP